MSDEPVRIKQRHISEYTPDPNNLRQHNPTNIGMIVDALHEVGAARSLVADENGVLLAGNGVAEAAAEAGITKVLEIETDGTELVIVKRVGLTDEQKQALAIYDNRTGETSTWDVEKLKGMMDAGSVDASKFWSEKGLQKLFGGQSHDEPEGVAIDTTWMVIVECTDEEHQRTLLDRLLKEGLACKAVVS